MGMPAFSTTTVRWLIAATRRTSSSCRPGSARVRRSKPSLSVIGGDPTTTTATSARPAACSASASIASSSAAGTMPSRSASGPSPSTAGRNSSRISACRPASSTAVALISPGRAMASTGSSGTVVSPSATTAPSTASVRCPIPAAPSRCGPVLSGRNDVVAVMLPGWPQPMPGGIWSHQASAVDVRCSAPSRPPSRSRYSSSSPGSPVLGSRSDPASGSGTTTHVWHPGATVTSACPANAAASPAAGVDTVFGITTALPPPWMAGRIAFGPITATRRTRAGSIGSAASFSLRNRTNDAAAARRRRAGSTGAGTGAAPSVGPVRAPTRLASRSRRITLSSSTSAATEPSATAAASCPPHGPSGPGIARSRAARAVPAVLRAACQSDVTTPSKPHSPFSTSRSRRACSVIGIPLTLL